ncbi:MAG: response regulator [Gemmataceae bacterium]
MTALWPDVVFLDLGLPGISGNEVARRIRQNGDSRKQPLIIAMTGHIEQAGLFETDGFDHYLLKPVDFDQYEMIHRFVEEAQIGGQLQHPGIVPVYELGNTSEGRLYFAMKLIRGQTLSQLLKERTNPSQDRFLKIFDQFVKHWPMCTRAA